MPTALLIGIVLFVVFLLLFWVLTQKAMTKEYGEKMMRQWTSRLYYWQAGIYGSAVLSFLIMYFLVHMDIVQL